MSIDPNPVETPREKPLWTCPSCGATADKGVGPVAADGSMGTVVCGACGAKFPEFPAPPENAANATPAPSGRNPLVLVVVALVVAGMLYFGFHMARRSGLDAPSVLGKSTPAPDFTLESLEGKNMKLSDFRGKAVALNFWATWCGPCKIETPWLVQLQNEYGGQGLQVVGVAMDDSGKEEIAKFAKEMGMNYPVLLGKEAVGDAYGGVPALPETFFIGRDGKIVGHIKGLLGRSDIEDAIKKALSTQASSHMPDNPAGVLQAQK